MIVTEEEAKKKMCPETIQPVGTSDHIFCEGQNCMASACMAWRWHANAIPEQYETITTKDGALPTHDSGWYKVDNATYINSNDGSLIDWAWRRVSKPAQARTGYCGKAGKP